MYGDTQRRYVKKKYIYIRYIIYIKIILYLEVFTELASNFVSLVWVDI